MKTLRLKDILLKIQYEQFIGNELQEVTKFVPLFNDKQNATYLIWVKGNNKLAVQNINQGTLIIEKQLINEINTSCNCIVVKNPRDTFREILSLFFTEQILPKISKSAKIDKSAIIGKNVFIGENVIIEKDCIIKDNTIIMHNSVILANSIIGKNNIIGSNCTIGGTGFGYEKDPNGKFNLIPHIGNVVLKDNVEIGNNTCIDRAVLGNTLLEENVKVDNLVHIAHGVKIKKNSVIIANSMIAGSVEIGENSWIAPSASILNQKKVGKNSIIGLGAVVVKDVEDNAIFAGNPAKFIRKI